MIVNATPLILLSEINKLELLRKVFGSITIPTAVKNEVLVKGKPGYLLLQDFLKEKWIKVDAPKENLNLNIGEGEKEAISLAKETKDTLLIDDASAVKIALAYGIPVLRTTAVLFLALKKGIIIKKEAVQLLNNLLAEGYYIKPAEYAVLLTRLNEY